MIKKIFLILIVLFLTSGAYAEEVEGKKKQFSFNSIFTVINNYYWRGEYLYPEGVPSFQPEATLTYEKVPVSLNIWSSIPLRKRAQLSDVKDELDIQFSGDISISKKLTLTLGLEEYTYPFATMFSHTEELYAVFSYELPHGFGLEFDSYVDVNDLKGIYLGFFPFYQTSIHKDLDLKLQMLLSYANYSVSKPQFRELGFRAQLAWQLSDYISLNTAALYNYNYSAGKNLYAVCMGLGFGI